MTDSESTTPASPNGCVNPSGSSLVKDGPVLCLMNKRLRALKNKYNRILQIEESQAQGKVNNNKEQDDVLRSKASVSVLIEEYEKLRQALAVAVKQEIAEKEKELLEENAASKEPTAEDGVVTKGTHDTHDSDEVKTSEATPPAEGDDAKDGVGLFDEAIAELLKILYFAHLFDVTSQNDFASMKWTKMHERSSCLYL